MKFIPNFVKSLTQTKGKKTFNFDNNGGKKGHSKHSLQEGLNLMLKVCVLQQKLLKGATNTILNKMPCRRRENRAMPL